MILFQDWGTRDQETGWLAAGIEDAIARSLGAWRGAFQGLGVIHGFENSWGPFLLLDEDQPGLAFLLQLRRFFTEIVPFARLRPAPDLIEPAVWAPGYRPLALATAERDLLAVYLPIGGAVDVRIPADRGWSARWFDPRRGEVAEARVGHSSRQPGTARFQAPESRRERPDDWVLVLLSDRSGRSAR